LKKVCYKVSLCENVQTQSHEAVTCLSNRAQMVRENVPYVKIWPKPTTPSKGGLAIDIHLQT